MDSTECFSPGLGTRASQPIKAAFAALLAVPAVLLTGCLTTEPPSSAITPSHVEKTFSPQPVPPNKPIELTLGPTTKDRAEVAAPVKQPQKGVEAPKPKVEAVAQPKLVTVSPKNAPADAKKVPAAVGSVSVRPSEAVPRPAVVSTVSAPQGSETPGALIFKGDKNAARACYGGNHQGGFGKNAWKWFGGAILLAGLAYVCCPPLRGRITTFKDDLARRADVSRRKWSSRGKFKVKGGAKLAAATPFGMTLEGTRSKRRLKAEV
jgi:hypothetical protein